MDAGQGRYLARMLLNLMSVHIGTYTRFLKHAPVIALISEKEGVPLIAKPKYVK